MTQEQQIRQLTAKVNKLTVLVERLLDERGRENNLMTVSEFAKAVGCSKGTVLNRIKAGIYGAERHGKLWYLPAPSRK
jgi:excisionase family DNA binding protein